MKVADYVIYSDEYVGVKQARIVEVDIRIEVTEPETHWDYPYGLTKDTGTVKIKHDDTIDVENLANLIKYSGSAMTRLQNLYDKWQAKKTIADECKETFLSKVRELRLE